MTSVNIFTAEMEYDEEDPAGYNAAVSNVGKQAGGDELAVTHNRDPAAQVEHLVEVVGDIEGPDSRLA